MQNINVRKILVKPIQIEIFGKEFFPPFFVILIALVLILLAFFARSVLLKDKWRTLDVNRYGFSIDYPALLYDKIYPSSGGRGKNLDYLRAGMGSWGLIAEIHQTEMDNPTLTDAMEWGESIFGWSGKGRDPLIETKIGQGDYPALVQTYYENQGSGITRIKAFYVVTEDNANMIAFYRVNEEREPTIQRMTDSFRFHDEGAD